MEPGDSIRCRLSCSSAELARRAYLRLSIDSYIRKLLGITVVAILFLQKPTMATRLLEMHTYLPLTEASPYIITNSTRPSPWKIQIIQ